MARPLNELFEECLATTHAAIVEHPHGNLFAAAPEHLIAARPVAHVKPATQPVVERWIGDAMAAAQDGPWASLARHLGEAHYQLHWNRAYENLAESRRLATFRDHYAYALLVGPIRRGRLCAPLHSDRLLFGFTLQAPHVLYPDHHHEPPELYGVISGHLEWQLSEQGWELKAPGDKIVHRSHELHSMRTTESPTLAWVLWPQDPNAHVYMPTHDPPGAGATPIYYAGG